MAVSGRRVHSPLWRNTSSVPAERMDLTTEVKGVFTYMPPKSSRVSGDRFSSTWTSISAHTSTRSPRPPGRDLKRSARKTTTSTTISDNSACNDNTADI